MSAIDGINSLDCKILQYKYSIHKAKSFLKYLNTISVLETETPPKLRLCHYLTLLSGNLFAINEGIFNNKLELLSQFRLIKVNPVNISPIVSHIPYDTNDINVNPLTNLPTVETSVKCTKLLATLYTNCIQGYEKRLQQALSEKGQISEDYLKKYDELVESTFVSELDIDLVGSKDLSFELTQDNTLLNDSTFMEATLIDIDIKMIFVILKAIRTSLDHSKTFIDKFKSLKARPENLNKFKDPQYSLHRILLITLRLNDLYVILRRFGRKIYLSNFSHLNDQKFLMITNNSSYFKGTILRAIDELFNQTKKNGVLIANLTRLIRANSKFEANIKNILDFNNFISQGHMIIDNVVIKFEEFGKTWVQSELKFRKTYNLPKFYILEIYHDLQKDEAPKIKTVNKLKSEQSKLEAFPLIDEAYIDKTKKLDSDQSSSTSREKSIFNRPSRSSSVSSNSSVSPATLNRRSSITSVNSTTSKPNSVPTRTLSNRQQRPNSMIFLNNNGSTPSLTKSQPQAATTRRRSNPHNISPEAVAKLQLNGLPVLPSNSANGSNIDVQSPNSSPLNSRIASSGAAAALKHNNKALSPSNSLKVNPLISPSNSIKRKSSVTRNSLTLKNSPNKVQPIMEEETKKLSANQRLQKHLQEAARSGSLMTQEKEVLASVVFDPNDPAALSLKRYSERKDTSNNNGVKNPFNLSGNVDKPQSGDVLETPTGPVSIPVPTKTKRKTRDEVTKLNTKRNSELITLTSQSSKPSTDGSSACTDISNGEDANIKQVRFIGVPQYTEAEDAPTSYSAKILKNFPVFKTPGIKHGYKRKDQMLKKEESISFKQLNHQNLLNNPRGIISPPSPATQSKFLPNSLQNTKLKIKSKLS